MLCWWTRHSLCKKYFKKKLVYTYKDIRLTTILLLYMSCIYILKYFTKRKLTRYLWFRKTSVTNGSINLQIFIHFNFRCDYILPDKWPFILDLCVNGSSIFIYSYLILWLLLRIFIFLQMPFILNEYLMCICKSSK